MSLPSATGCPCRCLRPVPKDRGPTWVEGQWRVTCSGERSREGESRGNNREGESRGKWGNILEKPWMVSREKGIAEGHKASGWFHARHQGVVRLRLSMCPATPHLRKPLPGLAGPERWCPCLSLQGLEEPLLPPLLGWLHPGAGCTLVGPCHVLRPPCWYGSPTRGRTACPLSRVPFFAPCSAFPCEEAAGACLAFMNHTE